MQWLPYKWNYQLIYLIYRWILALYFFTWLIIAGLQSCASKYFIYFPNWAFIIFNMYLTIAALSVTTKFVLVQLESDYHNMSLHKREGKPPMGLFGYNDNQISWYQVIHWIFFVMGIELVFDGCILFWILAYDQQTWDGVGVNTHIVSGVIAVLDFWICGIPMNPYHVVYLVMFGAAYFGFTGLYYVGTGDIIYPLLDYDINIAIAVVVSILAVLVGIPIIHFIFYLQHKIKALIMSCY